MKATAAPAAITQRSGRGPTARRGPGRSGRGAGGRRSRLGSGEPERAHLVEARGRPRRADLDGERSADDERRRRRAVAVVGSRRALDFLCIGLLWIALAGAGVALLWSPGVDLDPAGLGFAFGAAIGSS